MPEAGPCDVEVLFGLDLAGLLRMGRGEAAQPVRLASGLGVWLQARLQARDGVDFGHAVSMAPTMQPILPDVNAQSVEAEPAPPPTAGSESRPVGDGTLRGHGRKLIEETLAAHGGNISHAARQLRVSRGTLYRHLKSWRVNE